MVALVTEAILKRFLAATAGGDGDEFAAQEPGAAVTLNEQKLCHWCPAQKTIKSYPCP